VLLVTQLFNYAWYTRKQSSNLLKRVDPPAALAVSQVCTLS
jgi:hypothetical protein